MSLLATVALAILHSLYRLVLVLKSLATRFRKDPLPLTAQRSKLPAHLALTLVADSDEDEEANEKYMLNTVERVSEWCQATGIRRLTVYDHDGVLANCSIDVRERLLPQVEGEDARDSPVECGIQYPPTPPPSDDADSRPLSPREAPPVPKLSVTTIQLRSVAPRAKRRTSVSRTNVKRRRVPRNAEKPDEPPLTVHVISFKSSKPAVAAAASVLLAELGDNTGNPMTRASIGSAIQELNAVLEGEYGFPSPDLMIVHRKPPVKQLRSPVELHGFPPWQTRLTEIFWEPYVPTRLWWRSASRASVPHVTEEEFRRALDEFAAAEMRVGK